jgi:hypothetical protein
VVKSDGSRNGICTNSFLLSSKHVSSVCVLLDWVPLWLPTNNLSSLEPCSQSRGSEHVLHGLDVIATELRIQKCDLIKQQHDVPYQSRHFRHFPCHSLNNVQETVSAGRRGGSLQRIKACHACRGVNVLAMLREMPLYVCCNKPSHIIFTHRIRKPL